MIGIARNLSLQVKYEEASQVANDAVGNIRTVASFCAEMRVMDTYEKKCEGPLKNGVQQGIISGLGFGFSFAVLYVGYAICFYAGAHFIHHGSATFSQVFKVSSDLLIYSIYSNVPYYLLSLHFEKKYSQV